jgi:hypothetical protein
LDEIEKFKDTSEQYFTVLEKVLRAVSEGLDLAGLLDKLADKIVSLPVVETGTDGMRREEGRGGREEGGGRRGREEGEGREEGGRREEGGGRRRDDIFTIG